MRQVSPEILPPIVRSQHFVSEISPRHSRALYNRRANEINTTIESIMTLGRLEKMELITINNRALNNRGKVQRSSWMNSKYSPEEKRYFLPDLENLQLDTRTNKSVKKRQETQYSSNKQMERDEKLQQLIQEQMIKIKSKGLPKSQTQRKKLVENACSIIRKKLKSIKRISTQPNQKSNNKNENSQSKKKYVHKRAITDAVYENSLQSISKRQQFFIRQKKDQKKKLEKRLKRISLPYSIES